MLKVIKSAKKRKKFIVANSLGKSKKAGCA